MRFIVFAWLALVVALSLIPLPFKVELGTTGSFHKAGHFAIFFVTAALLCWNTAKLHLKLLQAVLAVVLAMTLEWLEVIFYHAAFEWKDVFVDSCGVLLGMGAILVIEKMGLMSRRRALSNRI
jgi:glycopeptide antibiotics resistance protein